MIIGMYRTLITLLFPILKATYIKKRQKIGKEHSTRFNERLGEYIHPRPQGKLYWMHGASVGEAISMLPLIDKLLKEDENLSIMVTTGTLTSAEIMAKRLPTRAFHQFIPYDTPKFAKNLLNHFKPNAVLWFESEFWPSLLSEIKKYQIPLILVNGRISDKSFKLWQKFKFISKQMLNCFTLCLGQSAQDKDRLRILGAQNVDCVGNIKYAGIPLPLDENKLNTLKSAINNRPIFLISSTHHNEEEQLAEHFQKLQQAIPDILIIIVPRHPNRGQDIAKMLTNKGYQISLRSKDEPITAKTEIYIADTIGEMGLWYNMSGICFIGGSFIPHGGQNFIEPARDRNAILTGPHMHNFAEMIQRAKDADAIWQYDSPKDMIEDVIMLLKDNKQLQLRQEKAYNWTVKEAEVLTGIANALQRELNK